MVEFYNVRETTGVHESGYPSTVGSNAPQEPSNIKVFEGNNNQPSDLNIKKGPQLPVEKRMELNDLWAKIIRKPANTDSLRNKLLGIVSEIKSKGIQLKNDERDVINTLLYECNKNSLVRLDTEARNKAVNLRTGLANSIAKNIVAIEDQLNEATMTPSELKVLSKLKEALKNGKLDEKYADLDSQELEMLEYAFGCRNREIIHNREMFTADMDGGVYGLPPKNDINEKEMIFWVKNANDDFGIFSEANKDEKGTLTIGKLVNKAVSENLCTGDTKVIRQALEDYSVLYIFATKNNMSTDKAYDKLLSSGDIIEKYKTTSQTDINQETIEDVQRKIGHVGSDSLRQATIDITGFDPQK